MTAEERFDNMEFKMNLLFTNSAIDRLFYESNITKSEYQAILDLMTELNDKIEQGEKPHHYDFESAIYEIVPSRNGDYHFCELIAKLFAEEGCWENVFSTLYSHMPKFGGRVEY